jgi:hypothetical protein
MFCQVLTKWTLSLYHLVKTFWGPRVNQHPTSAPMWMDDVLMGAPFSSLPVPGLTKVANSSWPFFLALSSAQVKFFFLGNFFFPHPPHVPKSHLPTYSPTYPPAYLPAHLNYLPMHLGLLSPPPTHHPSSYLPAHLHTHLSTYVPINLFSYAPMH